ncbi:transcription repressor OFP7-like, partial [Asparagus officinalis]|uniref:transcription repressor OFP7-like n=1 Tax=Asparagus officinalis TaxID=4686 RepID=UPI00098DF277
TVGKKGRRRRRRRKVKRRLHGEHEPAKAAAEPPLRPRPSSEPHAVPHLRHPAASSPPPPRRDTSSAAASPLPPPKAFHPPLPSTAPSQSPPPPASSPSTARLKPCRPSKASDPVDVVPYAVTFNVADKKDERELTQPGDSQATEEKELEAKRNDRRTNKKKVKPLLSNNAYGFTSSSDSESFSDDDGGRIEKDAGTFFSSRGFSSDSSVFYSRPSKRKAYKKKNKKQSKPPPPRKRTNSNKKGVPVMKRSNDPYTDFRSSMVEMIVERQIFGARDLERLLHSYLTLNSPHHHAAILRAFADISQVLYGH